MIGTGGMGSRHVNNIQQRISGAHVVGLFDVDAARLAALTATTCPDAAVFASPADLINDDRIDAVLIASPNDKHAEQTWQCVQAGKPVLCEKPLATTAAEAWRVIEAETALNRRLVTVGFMRRFDPPHTAVNDAVQAGRIGAAQLYKGTHRNESMPPGFPREYVVSQSAVHDIDAARWLLGQEVSRVYARGIRVDPTANADTLDLVLLTLDFGNGSLASIEVYLSARYGYEVTAEIVGAGGVATTRTSEPMLLRANNNRGVTMPGDWLGWFTDAYIIEVQAWVDGLRRGQPVGASAWDGYMAQLVSDACLTSLDSGQPEPVICPPKPAIY